MKIRLPDTQNRQRIFVGGRNIKKRIVKIIDGKTNSHILIITDMPFVDNKKDKMKISDQIRLERKEKNLGEMAGNWDSFIKSLQKHHYVKVIYDPRLDPPDNSDLLNMVHNTCYVNMTDEEIANHEIKESGRAFDESRKNERGTIHERYAEHEPAGIYL